MGLVDEFEKELSKRANAKFGEWHAIDLHNHTPQSEDYQYRDDDVVERLAQRVRDARLSVVMFTDHGRLPEADFVNRLSDRTGRLILRGAELNVFVDAWDNPENKVDKALFFHLLVGFDPSSAESPEYWMTDIQRRCSGESRTSQGKTLNGISASVTTLFSVLQDANALLIPAHLHSTPNAFKSRSIDDIYADPEFLKHAREHFTALEVTSEGTAAFFDGQHEETGRLHKSCIQSSDSHHPDRLGWRPSYLQLQDLNYEQVKTGLELPFRCSLKAPATPSNYVCGVHVHGQFISDLWLSFSPYCNALIGVKGAGKTSLLEALRFVLGADVPASKAQVVSDHLNAILGAAGRVRALVRRADGSRLLIERSIADKTFQVTFEDDRIERFSHAESLQFPSYILGWHEIEQAATDINIRRLYMDSIAGKEQVRTFTEQAQVAAAGIKNDHERAASAYTSFTQLEQQVERLKELRRGLKELSDANIIELRNSYQSATEHRESLRTALVRLRHAQKIARPHIARMLDGFNSKSLDGDSPLNESVGEARVIMSSVLTQINDSGASVESMLSGAVESLAVQVSRADEEFRVFSEQYAERVGTLTPEQSGLLESHRKVMEETANLPTLERERDGVRHLVESLLRGLIERCDAVTNCLENRTALRKEKIDQFADKVTPFGVRMALVSRQMPKQFEEYTQRYSEGTRVCNELRSNYSHNSWHQSLKMAYESLLRDLLAGYSLFFRTSEFSFFVSVFEDDDLQIELKVGQGDSDYRGIGQISAGQRCTAIFPILLKQQSGPLVVDQPEDNLDNRHIAAAIAPVVVQDKKSRQIMFTSHNANLVVLSDPELIVTFESDGSKCRVEEQGFLATPYSPITRHVVDILDGGEHALDLRRRKYNVRTRQ